MIDKTGFSIDVNVDPATGFKPLPDLVAFDLCKAYPVPGGNLLLRNTRTGQRAVVMPEVFSVLVSCDRFRTLDEHVARIIKKTPDMQGQQSDMRNVLQSMLDSGIMISAKQTCDVLKQSNKQGVSDSGTQSSADNPVVAIITWERPEALERLLNSVHANCNIDKFHRLYVIDDSRNPENINRNRELTATFALETKMPVQYFGQAEQQSLLKALSGKMPEHEAAIRFLADQSLWRDDWTSGLARNLALLLSCGHRLVMLDDDTICDVYDPGQPGPDITFSDQPREADFFSQAHEWTAQRVRLNPDPVSRHMQCLGMNFSEALQALGQNHLKPAGFRHANALLVSELKVDSPVLMTECGSFGCPGTSTNTWLPDMAPDSINRMLRSGQKTTNALNTRMVWTGRNRPHFSPRSNMSQITGFDNRKTLPPYFPILRGEDRLFGLLLDFIFPSAVTLDYPWAIPHLPIPQREWHEKDRDFTPGTVFPKFLAQHLLENKMLCRTEDPAERLATLATFFSNLAATSDDSLIASHRDAVLTDISEQLLHLNDLLAGADTAPEEWQDYLEQGIEQLSKGFGLASQEDFPVKGQPRSMEGTELITFWKRAWSGFSASLKAWPEIREAAAEIVSSR